MENKPQRCIIKQRDTTINNFKTNNIMALIKCPECGKKVSDKANACIHCGYPLNEQKEDFHIIENSYLDEDTVIDNIHKIADNVLKSMEEKEPHSPFPKYGFGYYW